MQLIRRVARADPLIVDGVFAVALAVIAEVEVWSGGSGSRTLRAGVAVVMTLPLVLRRRFALPVLGVVMGAALAQSVADPDADVAGVLVVAIIVAAYSVAAHCGRRAAAAGGVVGLAALWGSVHLQGGGVGDYLFAGAIFVGSWLAGFVLRARYLRAQELEHRTELLEQEQETRARAAVAEERGRIARDLHDAVAHSMSVIVVQAGGERLGVAGQGAPARGGVRPVEETGRQEVVGVGRAGGGRRQGGQEGASGPAPQPRR